MQIVLCYPVEDAHLEQIRSTVPDADVYAATQDEIPVKIFDADIFCGHAKVPMPWDDVVAQGQLKWIQSSAAGLDHCLVPSVIDSDILVTGASGLFADQVAEQTMALLLGYLRSMHVFFRAQLEKEFIRRPTADLHGKTVGIVGLGGNGRRIADVLAPYRVKIVATDLFPYTKPDCVKDLWPAEELDRLLQKSDIVILAVPLTSQTKGMIGRREMAQMRAGSVLINVARGPVVVESALAAAIKSGHLGGAGVDVTEVEPLPPESPLWEMPNVLISPHVGAQSARRIDDTTDRVCENLRRFFAGEELVDVIDKKRGFSVPKPPA